MPRWTRRGLPGSAPAASAHARTAATPLLGATVLSTPPWITIKGGHDAAIATGVASSGLVVRWPCMAPSADRVECAVPGGMPECMTTALKRSGCRVTSSAAMLAPADKPGNGHARAVGRIHHAHLVDGIHDQGGLAVGPAGGGVEPVPAALRIGEAVLLGVEHHEALACGDRVHARADGKALGVLAAAMQHHHQRQPFAELDAGRPVEPVAAHACRLRTPCPRAIGQRRVALALLDRRLQNPTGGARVGTQRGLGERCNAAAKDLGPCCASVVVLPFQRRAFLRAAGLAGLPLQKSTI